LVGIDRDEIGNDFEAGIKATINCKKLV